MKISLEYYLKWLKWALSVAKRLVDRKDYASVYDFYAETVLVLEMLFRIGASFPEGRGIELASRFFKWALKNPDPLKPAREKMEAMQRNWNARLLADGD